MSQDHGGKDISLLAAADLSSYQYHFVKASAANTVNLQSTDGGKTVGILQDKPEAASDPALVRIGETSKVVAGAAFDVDALLKANTSGHAIVADTAGDWVGAQALEASSESGDIVEVIIRGFTIHASDS